MRDVNERMSAGEWLRQPEYNGLVVYDPDGWDRLNFEQSWAEQITKAEFDSRVAKSTCIWNSALSSAKEP